MNADADFLRSQIAEIRTLTQKPFGVNIMLMSPFVDQVAQVVIDEKVPVVTTGAGMPGKYMDSWTQAGLKIIPVVASVAFAKRLERMGAVAVIAEGAEAGGHVGELNTMALVPQVCDALNIPVIAAGGIADGRGMAAAFMLGAEGVQCGTCFLVAEECRVHPAYKEKIIKAGDTDTMVTGKKLGHPVRALKPRLHANSPKWKTTTILPNKRPTNSEPVPYAGLSWKATCRWVVTWPDKAPDLSKKSGRQKIS